MKRVVASNEPIFTDDPYLPLEHQLDLASTEAWDLFRVLRNQHRSFESDQFRNIATEIDAMKKKIRNLRKFTLGQE